MSAVDVKENNPEVPAPLPPATLAVEVFDKRHVHKAALVSVLDGRLFGKSPLGAFFRWNEWVFSRMPSTALNARTMHAYGQFLHALARTRRSRTVYFGTSFMRNRPQLELALRLLGGRGATVAGPKVLFLGCSIGAEAYSLVWAMRSRYPDLTLSVTATDISADAVEFARAGRYPLEGSEFTRERIFARLTAEERSELFEPCGNSLSVRSWLRERITWRVADAGDPQLGESLGPQDIVFANNFLCHLYPSEAEQCLRNAIRLVRPGGYLFASGVDLDVRTRTTRALGLEPIPDLIDEIHSGDPALTQDWPLRYWGLEPLDRRRDDWERRYCAVFRVPNGQPARATDESGAERATGKPVGSVQ